MNGLIQALRRYAGFERRRTCTLMITRNCNLNCTYCYEKHKSPNKAFDMSFETARAIIENELEYVKSSDKFNELEIDFIGGEPMMNFPLIKAVVEWLVSQPRDVPYICFATTNATLLRQHEAWLARYVHVLQLGGSYDGTPELQRINRGTGERFDVNLDVLRRLYPEQGLHMVVSKETLPSLASGVEAIKRMGFHLDVALAQGVDWDRNDAFVYKQELEKIALLCLHNLDSEPINLLLPYLGTIAQNTSTYTQKKYCGTGTAMVTYDYDGKQYGCHLFTPVVLGDMAFPLEHMKFSCNTELEDKYCKNCCLKAVCPTCAGFNHIYRGDIACRDKKWCNLILAEVLVACRFQIKAFAQESELDETAKLFAQGAMDAYTILKHFRLDDMPPFVASQMQSRKERR